MISSKICAILALVCVIWGAVAGHKGVIKPEENTQRRDGNSNNFGSGLAKPSRMQSHPTEGPNSWLTASTAAPWLTTQLPEASSNDIEQAIIQAMSNHRLPKGLSRLLFNGNETVRFVDVATGLKEPRTKGDDEYACINRCGLLEHPAYVPECKTVMETKSCVKNCTKNNARNVLVRYVSNLMELNTRYSCSGENTTGRLAVTQELMTNCTVAMLSDTPKLVNTTRMTLQCYLDLEVAKDDAAACIVLKDYVKDTFAIFAGLEDCLLSTAEIQVLEIVYVYGLTYLSDGRLVKACPALYSSIH